MTAVLTKTSYEHVLLDENGTPTIKGTTMKVVLPWLIIGNINKR